MIKKMLNFIRKLIPEQFIYRYRILFNRREYMQLEKMNLESKFSMIYEKNIWGKDNTQKYYSGSGSHNSEIVDQYVLSIHNFLDGLNIEKNIVDLGCGDFNVGHRILEKSDNYIACDIVNDLIEYNSKKFISPKLVFKKLNIVEDDLPNGNIVFLRQVLQHLSNQDIIRVVPKLYNYQYVIITEHIPKEKKFTPNKEYFSGPSIRLERKSGVVLTEKPFNFICKNKYNICSVNENGGVILTTVYEIY